MTQVHRHNTFLGPQQPSPSSTEPSRSEPAALSHAMEKEEVLDGRNTMPLGIPFHSAVRQRTGSRLSALTPWDEESSEEDTPFLPRFLLQEPIFAHNSNEGHSHNRPGLLRNLLCRLDRLHSRGISETECLILPIRELAAFLRCSLCESRLDSSPAAQYDSVLGQRH